MPRAGFDNVNLDLMYGLPQQSLTQWQDTVARTLALTPEHLSLYSLTLEEGTPLRHWVEQGRAPGAGRRFSRRYVRLRSRRPRRRRLSPLRNQQLVSYRAGIGAQPGLLAQPQWLGVGPGAHSSLGVADAIGGCRFWTVRSPRDYARKAAEWAATAEPWESATAAGIDSVPTVDGLEVIDEATAAAETMFLGLRLLDGMDVAAASERVGIDLLARYETELAELTADGLLLWEDDGRLRLGEGAYLVGNQVFTRFLVE